MQQAPAPQVRKQLTLTKEQMFEAQEMFRTANKVTRPEKALILGFMAGSRDNPCPHLGMNICSLYSTLFSQFWSIFVYFVDYII